MTISVWDGSVLAADRQITTGSFITDYRKKIDKYSRGYFVVAGFEEDVIPFRDWLEDDVKFSPNKSFTALYTEDGVMFFIDYALKPVIAPVPCAIGESTDVAGALVRSGLSAVDVVKEMSRTNIYCGGKTDSVVIK